MFASSLSSEVDLRFVSQARRACLARQSEDCPTPAEDDGALAAPEQARIAVELIPEPSKATLRPPSSRRTPVEAPPGGDGGYAAFADSFVRGSRPAFA